MNRNSYDYFSNVPRANIGRSVFNRDSSAKTTFNVGDLIPIYCDEVLPGDTWSIQTSKVVRLQTLLAPIMDNIYLDTYWFYVPNELVWDHWREFCGENTESAWAPQTEYTIPKLLPALSDGTFEPKSLADYFGIPVGKAVHWLNYGVNALPFRGYAMIVDSFFRDQNLLDPVYIYKGDGNIRHDPSTDYVNGLYKGGKPFRVAKFHDYFTSVLPAPQKGDPVQMPISASGNGAYFGTNFLPVIPSGSTTLEAYIASKGTSNISPLEMWFGNNLASSDAQDNLKLTRGGTVPDSGDPLYAVSPQIGEPYFGNGYPANLVADISTGNFGFDINAFRLAYQTQSYLEALARGGSRYTEQLLSIFGVTSPDARLHEPEYLGGNRIPIQIHQVTAQSSTESTFLGQTGAMSVTSDSHFDFTKSFTEHGYIFGLCCVRYDHSYSQGVEKMWLRNNYLDFYNPYFANIGELPVKNIELYAMSESEEASADITNDGVFGYQQAWSEYRYKNNRVTGDMRPDSTSSLATWNLADDYDSPPVLSPEWLQEDPNNVDRALAVQHTIADSVLADFFFSCKVTRPMPMYSIPGLASHE